MNTLKQLEARFPYQFTGPNIGISIAPGWNPIFQQLCEQIDELLGDDKKGFHWEQCKEKFGSARLYWSMRGNGSGIKVNFISEVGDVTSLNIPKKEKPGSSVSEQIGALIDAAEGKTRHACIICGEPGKTNNQDGFVLVLCEEHARQRRAGDLPSNWFWDDA